MTGGILKSDPSFSPGIDAEFVGTGNDYIHADPDGQHLRLNAHGVVKYVLWCSWYQCIKCWLAFFSRQD